MNDKQRNVLIIGFLLLALSFFYRPMHRHLITKNRPEPAGELRYMSVFESTQEVADNPWDIYEYQLDHSIFWAEIALIVIGTGLCFWMTKDGWPDPKK